MILIQSSQNDASTDDVIDWLRYLYPALEYRRVNDEAVIEKMAHSISNVGESLQLRTQRNQEIDLKAIDSRWYRRGYFEFDSIRHNLKSREVSDISFTFSEYLDMEFDSVKEAIDTTLSRSTPSLNGYRDNNTNKISNLTIAARSGITIPDTLVTNKVDALKAFYEKHERVITKAIFRNFLAVDFGDYCTVGFSCDTTVLNAEIFSELITTYAHRASLPALFQQYIDKAYELRIFFIKHLIYPMAVFSQSAPNTRIDMRNYDRECPNRCVPFTLPGTIERKLCTFIEETGLTSGSIDMIVTPNNDYVFLEVNPVGKYQWLREHCNYDIDESIARFLANPYDYEQPR